MKMKTNPYLNAAIMEVVDNQLRELNPPEAMETYNRLVTSGHSDAEARRLIGIAVTSEIFDVLKNKQKYVPERYIACLRKLPKLPWE